MSEARSDEEFSEGRPAIRACLEHRDRLPAGWSWEHLCWRWCFRVHVAWWASRLLRIMRFHRLMNEIEPASEEWQARTVRACGIGWVSAQARRLYLVPGRVPPMLWAIGGRPRLLVPSELWSATSLERRTSLLLHELAHLKRRDHWVRWLELIVGGLYWWHPAVWWGRRLLREAEEQCCDAWVVWAMPQGAKTYATALLAAIEFVSGARTAPAASSAASGNGHVSCLKRRLKMIVRAQNPERPVLGRPSGRTGSGHVAAAPGTKTRGQTGDRADEQQSLLASQDDDGPKKEGEGGRGRATAERFEEHVKELIEKLTKELGPVGEETPQDPRKVDRRDP